MKSGFRYGRALLAIFAAFFVSTAAIAQEARPLSKGQTVYLPIYSHMLYGNLGKRGVASSVLLSALVSIRNTDPSRVGRSFAGTAQPCRATALLCRKQPAKEEAENFCKTGTRILILRSGKYKL